MRKRLGAPHKQGLYDPRFEHEACGIGFIAQIKGVQSNRIVQQGIQMLLNLDHRGARGCEENTGDGAGILLQMPHRFMRKAAGFSLPEAGDYGVAMIFLPREQRVREEVESRIEQVVTSEGQQILGWREVPTCNVALGETAKLAEPVVRQLFIGKGPELADQAAFERKLYVIRKLCENQIKLPGQQDNPYFVSLSSRTLVYKGMLNCDQLTGYYPDLTSEEMESAICLVHSRFSTNTFPSWERAHPYRFMIHNGEINTLKGNVNWMKAREASYQSQLFGQDLQKLLPLIDEDGSDSAIFDNVLEFLVRGGRSLEHAIMMMIPEPWQNHTQMDAGRKAFYRYHACLMEPWDGPASIAFTDGQKVGAVLDRNGLRPSRYYVTSDDRVILSSEVGVLDIPPEQVIQKGRLEPGRIFLVDTEQGRVISDEEVKESLASARPYQSWVNKNLISLADIKAQHPDVPGETFDQSTLIQLQEVFGYTVEDLKILMGPMATDGKEAIGSMGNDTPLSVLSNRPQLLYGYFKQLFAQVTNPPLDAIREEVVTATEMLIGTEGNLLEPSAGDCRQLSLPGPILSNKELALLQEIDLPGFHTATLPILFAANSGARGLEKALEALFFKADELISQGKNILILSDRDLDPERTPIPALLAVSGLHHHLIREGTRTKVSILLESGEPREVHHFSLLVGYGASAVNPYLAFQTIRGMISDGFITGVSYPRAVRYFINAIFKGMLKVISKMGISTIQSYHGAQIFEAVGLSSRLVEHYFPGTASRIEGAGLAVLAKEVTLRHEKAYSRLSGDDGELEQGGEYQWREGGEMHLTNPLTVHLLQNACRKNDYSIFKQFSKNIDDQNKEACALRGLMVFKFPAEPIPLEEVEPVEEIVRRFKTGAMSYGSISQETHESLAVAMNRLGGKSNTGEGGEDSRRFVPYPNGDSKNSAIKQVASGRFGVTSEYLVNSQEIQIKMAQGAKPGEGGQLPGNKVYPWIAKVRFSTPGVELISPPPHHDIYSIEDLAQLIHDLKNANSEARISVKLVSEVGVGTVAAGVAKGKADVVLISGYDGGTGASPQSSIKHAGLPWELGLAETHQTLLLNNLRSRIAVETDGGLKTGRDVVVAALLGAEEFGFSTSPLVALGCVMMRVCHLNTCPVGIATQDPVLRSKFTGDPKHVENLMLFIAQEVRELMAQLGFRKFEEMIGRSDRMEMEKAIHQWKGRRLDLSPLLYQPEIGQEVGHYCQIDQNHGLEHSLDQTHLIDLCEPALERGEPVQVVLPIRNTHRTVGTQLGSLLTRKYGAEGLPEDTIQATFQGSAGQSFGAFIPSGMTFILEGDANDYTGKGLSGGKIIVYPPKGSILKPEENIILGNVAFYGATGGEAYIRGRAGERFCVRNSGLKAVIEGVGDHGCEYMTGGRVVVLGKTGRNFAAGMTGGVAYILDPDGAFLDNYNPETVEVGHLLDPAEIDEVKSLIGRHVLHTNSALAETLLDNWPASVERFRKVLPTDYKRMLDCIERVSAQKFDSEEERLMAAFNEKVGELVAV